MHANGAISPSIDRNGKDGNARNPLLQGSIPNWHGIC